MKPHEVRARILSDHETIRGILDEISELNERFEEGGSDVGVQLTQVGVGLIEIFASHLDLEDKLLVPALRTIPELGERMARRLSHEHREQRELLDYLMRRLGQDQRPTTLIARELESFAQYLRTDMAHEEETLLREDLLV